MTYHNAAAILADPATAVVERAPLTKAFEIVNQAVENRNTLPILSNARLIGDGSSLFITGTDLDLELSVSIPAAADSRFALTLPAGRMRDLLKKATASDFVAFTMPDDSNAATVDFERVKYRLAALPVADFPELRGPSPLEFDGVTVDSSYRSFTMTGAAFWAAIDATMGAMSTEETRYYLNGIYMHVAHDGTLRFVATDGHRLYRQDMAAPNGSADMLGIILPKKTVALLYKLMKGKACPDSIGIEVTSTKARFTWGDPGFYVSLQSKLIDGTFPDYERVIPAFNDKPATFDPESMLEAIRAVSLISSERGRAVRMEFDAGKCGLIVNNPDAGSASADITCQYDSERVEIGFNARYMVDAIPTASPDGGAVSITMADAGSPATITGSRDGWLGVLMPMRV
jgi:DNA polymerase-3 subunit beta